MAKQPLVAVYSPTGEREMHTRANARDLINTGYTWAPGVPASPVAHVPFMATKAPTRTEPAQAVLDSAGHNSERTAAGAFAGDDDADEEVFDLGATVTAVAEAAQDAVEEAAAEAEAEAVVEAVAEVEVVETPAEADAPKGRGRGGRKAS